jgi:hypothetical protein
MQKHTFSATAILRGSSLQEQHRAAHGACNMPHSEISLHASAERRTTLRCLPSCGTVDVRTHLLPTCALPAISRSAELLPSATAARLCCCAALTVLRACAHLPALACLCLFTPAGFRFWSMGGCFWHFTMSLLHHCRFLCLPATCHLSHI